MIYTWYLKEPSRQDPSFGLLVFRSSELGNPTQKTLVKIDRFWSKLTDFSQKRRRSSLCGRPIIVIIIITNLRPSGQNPLKMPVIQFLHL